MCRPAAESTKSGDVAPPNNYLKSLYLLTGTAIATEPAESLSVKPRLGEAGLDCGEKVMGLFDALTSAVSGLQGQSFAMQNISGNIANSQTIAYKGINTSFSDLIPGDSIPSKQVAGGVIANAQATNNVQGAIQTATSSTDMAINGDGFFVVQSPTSFAGNLPVFGGVDNYTRRGDFQLDANGYLVNGSGYYLEGMPIDPTTGNPTGTVAAPLQFQNNFLPAVATTQVTYGINLPTLPQTTAYSSSTPNSELLNPADFAGGSPLIPADGGTGVVEGQDVSTFIKESIDGGSVTVYSTTGTQANLQLRWAKVKSVASGGTDTWELFYQTDSTATSGTKIAWRNAGIDFTFNSAGQLNPAVTSVPLNGITVDGIALGNVTPTTLTGSGANFAANDSANTFTIDDGSGNGPVSITTTSFNGTQTAQSVVNQINTNLAAAGSTVAATVSGGQIELVNNTGKTITVAGTAATDLGFGAGNTTSSNGVAGNITLSTPTGAITQFASASGTATVNNLQQNGYGAGQLQSISVANTGIISGTFSNGQNVALAEVPLVHFNSPNNLKSLNGGAYSLTDASGPALAGASGKIVGQSLEASNTDIATEFTKLIVTQQAYSANTKVITTANQMSQDLLNVIR
jgi:flagellar hook protein FlgE